MRIDIPLPVPIPPTGITVCPQIYTEKFPMVMLELIHFSWENMPTLKIYEKYTLTGSWDPAFTLTEQSKFMSVLNAKILSQPKIFFSPQP